MHVLGLTTHVSTAPPSEPTWTDLIRQSPRATVFQTRQWQQAWWHAYGEGERLFVAVECGSQLLTMAPCYIKEKMAFFVGSGGSDYLDFLGDTRPHDAMVEILKAVRGAIPGFVGCHFYHVPDDALTGAQLQRAADALGWDCYQEGMQVAPSLHIADAPQIAQAAIQKKSLRRHEQFFRREGALEVVHYDRGEAMKPHLAEFFDQHRNRWATTCSPSLFCEPRHCEFYHRLVEQPDVDWLRFTRVEWNGFPIAFHFGFFYRGVFMWYKPSFAIELSRHSPGEVLLRKLILYAMDEGAEIFDFGLGDEAFKQRFATHSRTVRNWGLYPR